MTLEETKAVVASEELTEFAAFTSKLEANKVFLVRSDESWSVFATDERATVLGSIDRFDSIDDAATEFLDRLRAAKRIERRRRARSSRL